MNLMVAFSFTFFLALCMFAFIIYARSQEQSLTRRLSSQQDLVTTGPLLRLYKKVNDPIKADLRRSGLGVKITPEVMLAIITASVCFGIFIGLLLNNLAVSAMLGIAGFFAPKYWLESQVAKQQNEISETASVVIHSLITSFQFGVSVPNFKNAVEQMPANIQPYFEKVIAQLLAGEPDEEIIKEFNEKIENRYLQFALNNILIALRQGTDVTKILFNLMDSVSHEKVRIAKINKASAEANFMIAVSLGIMGLIILTYAALSPQFLETYVTTMAGKIAVASVVGVVLFCLHVFGKIKKIEI